MKFLYEYCVYIFYLLRPSNSSCMSPLPLKFMTSFSFYSNLPSPNLFSCVSLFLPPHLLSLFLLPFLPSSSILSLIIINDKTHHHYHHHYYYCYYYCTSFYSSSYSDSSSPIIYRQFLVYNLSEILFIIILIHSYMYFSCCL